MSKNNKSDVIAIKKEDNGDAPPRSITLKVSQKKKSFDINPEKDTLEDYRLKILADPDASSYAPPNGHFDFQYFDAKEKNIVKVPREDEKNLMAREFLGKKLQVAPSETKPFDVKVKSEPQVKSELPEGYVSFSPEKPIGQCFLDEVTRELEKRRNAVANGGFDPTKKVSECSPEELEIHCVLLRSELRLTSF